MTRRRIKNVILEAEQFQRRAFIGFLFVLVTFVSLSLGYLWLQVFRHDEYRTMAEENRIKPRPIVPARGLIYDRNGNLLADNVPAYRLEITPDQAGDIDKALAELKKIITLSAEDIEAFEKTRKSQRSFLPVTLKLKLNDEEVARFALERYRFPGVEVTPYLTRRYLHGDLLAHVIGYVGRVDEADLKKWEGTPLTALTHNGKTGIERFYEDRLHGVVGYTEEEVNVQGRRLRTVKKNASSAGEDLYLSIDLDLQRAMVDAFQGQQGAAVAMDPNTGEILAMVSLPTYDPNLFVNGISRKDFAALNTDVARPLFNRNVLGGFAPGSTMKPFMALAGLEYGLRTPSDQTYSRGEFFIPGQRRGYRDWKAGGHGPTNMTESLAQSVNTYYYKLAMDLGIERMDAYLYKLGFGQKTGIDMLGEKEGILPSPKWKQAHFGQKAAPWYVGETVVAGIGQGYWVTSPLQLVQATGVIANGGVRKPLTLLHATQSSFDAPKTLMQHPEGERVVSNAAHIAAVRDGMVAVLHSRTGTARSAAAGAPYLMAGKTGTAQRVSRKGTERLDPNRLPYHLRHQALFVGFAPADNPTIAVAVVAEHGGSGSKAAAPVARRIFDAWLVPKKEDEENKQDKQAISAQSEEQSLVDFDEIQTNPSTPPATQTQEQR
jgi:penicillin-binding protein 2